MSQPKKKMNLVQLTFIVAVNMMGSGIIMLPTNMAKVGAISLLSWIVTARGLDGPRLRLRAGGHIQPATRRPGGLRRRRLRQGRLLPGLLPVLPVAGHRQRRDRHLRSRLSRDVLPGNVRDADRHLHERDRAAVADHRRQLRRPRRHRKDRLHHRLGRHHPGGCVVVHRLVLVQLGNLCRRLESAGTLAR